jgi:hypothetical protein
MNSSFARTSRTFGVEKIHTLTFEDLTENPRGETDAVLAWLGLSPLPAGVEFQPENSRPERMVGVKGRGRLSAVRTNPAWSLLSPMIPGVLRDFGRRLALERVEFTKEHDEEVTRLLSPWASDVIDRSEALLGRAFPKWRRTVEDGRDAYAVGDGPRTGGIRDPSGSQ